MDELKAKGVRVSRVTESEVAGSARGKWFCVQEKCDSVVDAAVSALRREGVSLSALQTDANNAATWARDVAMQVGNGEYGGGVAFCANAALFCCVANKVAGIRAAVVAGAAQTAKALATIGANLLAVEMPGRTLFEARQILKTAASSKAACPGAVLNLLAEIEAHAHR
jgi:ribose 5-phosphate isomerase RpiB